MVEQTRPQHHIVYIPGLGDTKYPHIQRLAVYLWRTFGVYGHFHAVGWNDDQPFDAKLNGILEEVDSLTAQGYTVSVIGASAGASMALHTYAARKDRISGVVLICGEISDAQNVRESYYEENPAFKISMERLPKTLKQLSLQNRLRIMSIHPIFDETVPIKHTVLDGARMYTSISFGHSITIGFTLTIDFYIPLWFLMKWARQTH